MELDQWYIVQNTLFGHVSRKHGMNKTLGPRFVECVPKAYDPEREILEFTLEDNSMYQEKADTTAGAMQEKRGRVVLTAARIDKWFVVNKKEAKMRKFLCALPRIEPREPSE